MRRAPLTLLILLCAALLAPPAHAESPAPLLYSRDRLVIMRKNAPQPLPWNKDAPFNPAMGFDIEVRSGSSLYRQEGWYNLTPLSEDDGLLMLFPGPVTTPIIRASQYAPLDILMIDREGTIVQIAPSLVLANLEQEIPPPSPVLAFLFLKGGVCKKLSIFPGDVVRYGAFKRPPPVLMAPSPQAAPAPAQTSTPAPAAPPAASAAPATVDPYSTKQ